MSSEHEPSQRISQGNMTEVIERAVRRVIRQAEENPSSAIVLPATDEEWRLVIERINETIAPKSSSDASDSDSQSGDREGHK